MTREEVAHVLDEIAGLLELKGENTFRVNAYRNGARAVQQMEEDLAEVVEAGGLAGVKGIGEGLRDKITELVRTGRSEYAEQLRAEFPAGLMKMMRIPGLGPRKVKALFDAGIRTLDELKAGCDTNQVAAMKGFGAKTQAKIVEGIQFIETVGQRVRFDKAYPLGLALLQEIRRMPGVVRAELCGSLRRRRDTAKDIDILASATDAGPIMDAFVQLPQVMQVVAKGEAKSSIVAGYGLGGQRVVLNADLRVVADDVFAFAQHYFTGSKEHNKRMRQRAIDLGMKLSEYGLEGSGKQVTAATEAELFAGLGMAYVPPELREDTGEMEAALLGPLPKLVEVADIRGVFHNHSTYSDGQGTLAEMRAAVADLGFEYLGMGDHSRSLAVANGMSVERVRHQWKEIDALNADGNGPHVFKGVECDILGDGSLDYDDDILAGFDYVVASVHTLFGMSEKEMTARVIRAVRHPMVTMLGHATGRLLLRREAYKIDLDAVLRAAADSGTMVEINAQPDRLDLDWVHVKRAKSLGIPLVINPDAHSPESLALFQYGVNVARRGWLRAAEVFNTRGLTEVREELVRRKRKLTATTAKVSVAPSKPAKGRTQPTGDAGGGLFE